MTAAVFYDFKGETVEAARFEGPTATTVTDSDGRRSQPVKVGQFVLYRREGDVVRHEVLEAPDFLGEARQVAIIDRAAMFGPPVSEEQAQAFNEREREEIDRQRQARAAFRERSRKMAQENEKAAAGGEKREQQSTAGMTDPTGQLSAGPEGIGTAQPASIGGGEDPERSNNTDLVARQEGTALPPRNDGDPKDENVAGSQGKDRDGPVSGGPQPKAEQAPKGKGSRR